MYFSVIQGFNYFLVYVWYFKYLKFPLHYGSIVIRFLQLEYILVVCFMCKEAYV